MQDVNVVYAAWRAEEEGPKKKVLVEILSSLLRFQAIRISRRTLGYRDDDVVAQSLFDVWKGLPKGENIGAFLSRITKRYCFRKIRGERAIWKSGDTPLDEVVGKEDAYTTLYTSGNLDTVNTDLYWEQLLGSTAFTELELDVLTLTRGGLDIPEIMQALGKSLDSIKKALARIIDTGRKVGSEGRSPKVSYMS